jgi:prepilin-type processing-associated H-X9-DG protein
MEITTIVDCPTCGKKYRIGADKLGRTFKCVNCQTPFQAGETPAPEPDVLDFAEPAPVRSALTPSIPSPQSPAPTGDYSASQNTRYVQPTGRNNAMAIAALACGIPVCIPLVGFLAIVFGIIGISQTAQGQERGRGMAITGLVLGCISPLFWLLDLFVVPFLIVLIAGGASFGKALETANRAKCASNMHQIGLGILLYQNDSGGEFPPDLMTLATTENLSPGLFVCPSSSDTPASSISQLQSGGHLSYNYVYPGPLFVVRRLNLARTAVLYENSTDHAGDGTNILFGDGHVEWFNTADAQRFIHPNGFRGH